MIDEGKAKRLGFCDKAMERDARIKVISENKNKN